MKKIYILEDLCCANCAQKMEDKIAKVEGVNSVSVTFLSQKLKVDFEDDKEDKIVEQIKKIVKQIEPDVEIIEK